MYTSIPACIRLRVADLFIRSIFPMLPSLIHRSTHQASNDKKSRHEGPNHPSSCPISTSSKRKTELPSHLIRYSQTKRMLQHDCKKTSDSESGN